MTAVTTHENALEASKKKLADAFGRLESAIDHYIKDATLRPTPDQWEKVNGELKQVQEENKRLAHSLATLNTEYAKLCSISSEVVNDLSHSIDNLEMMLEAKDADS